jgi:hypothetical protein
VLGTDAPVVNIIALIDVVEQWSYRLALDVKLKLEEGVTVFWKIMLTILLLTAPANHYLGTEIVVIFVEINFTTSLR